MAKISFSHGGASYDEKYPDGIPTSVVITDKAGRAFDSGFVMYPSGHARNEVIDLNDIVANKVCVWARALSNSLFLILFDCLVRDK